LHLLCLFASAAPAYPKSLHVKVELLCEQSTVQPGGILNMGLRFKIQKGWHLYWRNPGDSGQAPSIQWNLPEGYVAGDIQWPLPQRFTYSKTADYGYKNEVLLIVPIRVPESAKSGHFARFSANARWLVCQEICIPGDAQLNLRLPIRKRVPALNSRNEYLFKSTRRNLPLEMPEGWRAEGWLGPKDIRLSFDTGSSFSKAVTALFFPLHPDQVENATPQGVRISGHSLHLTLKRSDQFAADVKSLEGLVVLKDAKSQEGYWVNVLLAGN
jgi:thiol:disulfide interchange protein DsbD